jgi:hypothetical protein
MPEPSPEIQQGARIANRYKVERLLGRGGMAAVYEVLDESRGIHVALKRLLPAGDRRKSVEVLFQREYSTLAQLQHPLIIRAFDYGKDGSFPFYTMELIRGENLRALAPLPFREACSLARDVALALAIVHSRRLVHRDVTPRNVCRTESGRAKLLDFGTLAPMGEPRDVAGTPPFLPPENLDSQPLGARSDLFSLGAVLYFLLTARHAYPAARLSELRQVWNRVVEPPSVFAPDVPAPLDSLVLSMLGLNPLARPATATEVIDRLTAVASLPSVETPEAAQAYLTTPFLVARDAALQRFRRRLLRTERRRGGALVIEGPSGSGRSRLLASFLREAKLRGMFTVRAEGREGKAGPLGVVRALAASVVESEHAGDVDVSAKEALERLKIDAALVADEVTDGDALLSEKIGVFVEWFLSIAEKNNVVIGVDDMDDCDEHSAAALQRLCEEARTRHLFVVLTGEPTSPGSLLDHVKEAGASVTLWPFRSSETRALVTSLFGDVPQVEALSNWVHELSAGNARTALELAQHLVDTGVATYEQGAWVLPDSLDGFELPSNLEQALAKRIDALGPGARRLVEALSLTAEHGPLTLPEYPALVDGTDLSAVFASLNELVAAQVLVQVDDDTYAFVHDTMKDVVRRGIDESRRAAIHARIAHAYDSGPDPSQVLSGYHLFQSGDVAGAFAKLTKFISERIDHFVRGGGFIRSREGAAFYSSLFEWGEAHGAGPEDMALIGRGVLQLAAVSDASLARHAPKILSRLQRDAGLDFWSAFESITDPALRVQRALAEAYQRHESSREQDRGLPPGRAIQELAVSTALLAGLYGRTHNALAAKSLTSVMDPLRPLAPAVDVVANTIQFAADAMSGRVTRDLKLRVIDQVKSPVAGIDEVSRVGIGLITRYFLGLEEATLGLASAFSRVAPLEAHAYYAPLAWQVKVVASLFHGAQKQAEMYRRKRDLAMTARFDVDQHLETSVLYEAAAQGFLGDLVALKRLLPILEDRAKRWPGWGPHCELARGNCALLRGNPDEALAIFERALGGLSGPGEHVSWGSLTLRTIRILSDSGRSDEACWRGREALAKCKDYPLAPFYVDMLESTLAVAEARAGFNDTATERAGSVLARAEMLGTAGAFLVEVLEAQARVAFETGDRVTFDGAARRIASMCANTESAAFAKKHSSLLQLMQTTTFDGVHVAPSALQNIQSIPTTLAPDVLSEIERCVGSPERARRVLRELLERSLSDMGFLYLQGPQGLSLVASSHDLPAPPDVDRRVGEWMRTSLQMMDTTTASSHSVAVTPGRTAQSGFELIGIFADRDHEAVIAGVAALGASGRRPRPIPPGILVALGQALVDAGDAGAPAR